MHQQKKKAENGGHAPEGIVHLIVFRLGTEEFAIRIEQVKEVTITPDIAQMPRTPDYIKGVANIRGDIIAIMDLERRFRLPPAPMADNHGKKDSATYTLVIEREDFTMGILVREVPQSLTLPASNIDRTPGIIKMSGLQEAFLDGIAKDGDRLIIVLDALRLLSLEDMEQIQAEKFS